MKKVFLILLFMFNQLLAMVSVDDEFFKQSKITLQHIFTSYLEASNHHLIALEQLCNKNKACETDKKNKIILQTMKETNECQKKFLYEYQKIYVCSWSFQMLLEEKTIDSFCIDVSSLIEFMKNMQDQEKGSYDYQVYNSLCAFYKAILEEQTKKIETKGSNKISRCIQFFEQLSKRESQSHPKLPEKVQLS